MHGIGINCTPHVLSNITSVTAHTNSTGVFGLTFAQSTSNLTVGLANMASNITLYRADPLSKLLGFASYSDDFIYQLLVVTLNQPCAWNHLNPPYGQVSEGECFREDALPFGNFTVGQNSTDFEYVTEIQPYYSLIEATSCTSSDGKLQGI